MMTPSLKAPLPKRRAVTTLRERLIEYIVETRPKVGSPFPSLNELVAETGASHSTVRRALAAMQQEGWVERRLGKGTFVGPRAALPVIRRGGATDPRAAALRLGVVIFAMGDHRGDWYSQQVIQGIDAEAADHAEFAGTDGVTGEGKAGPAGRLIRVELYGTQGGNVRALSQRLMADRPDVLACVLTSIRDLAVAAEARRLGIPVIGAGYCMGQFGVPSVLADDAGGARLAVNHLLDHGHTRIGCLQLGVPRNYVFRRHEGYRDALEQAGLEYDESRVCWLTTGDGGGSAMPMGDVRMISRWQREIRGYLARANPTALVVSNGVIMEALAAMARDGAFRIPEDLSLVTFDQTFYIYRRVLGEVRPTVIALPWTEFGRRLVSMAGEIVERGDVAGHDPLPCTLLPGETVSPPRRTERLSRPRPSRWAAVPPEKD